MEQQLYDLPKGWSWSPLSSTTTVVGGGTPKTKESGYWGGNIVWLSPTDLPPVGELTYISDSTKKITEEGLARSSARIVPEGTVVYSTRATIGKIGIAGCELATNQGFTNFICSDELYNRYLAYVLVQQTPAISSLSNSTTFKEVSKTNIKNVEIPLPPLNEQKRIVAKLDALFTRIDAAITHLQETLELSKALFASALDGALVPGGNRNKLPTGWEWAELGEVCTLQNGDRGKNYPSRSAFVEIGIPVINAGNLTGEGVDSTGLNYITRERFDLISNGKVREGDILFCLRGTLGKVGLVEGIDEGVIASSLVIIRVDDELDNRFMLAYLNSHFCAEMIDKYDNGAAQPNLSAKNLKKFLIPLPPIEEQHRIVKRLDGIAERTYSLEADTQERLDQLTALKSSLLDAAFRGQLATHDLKEVADAG